WILGITGVALNKAVDLTVIQMGTNVNKINTIEAGWKTFRDLANIIIIFSLLYIGIVTILNSEKYNTKKLLASLIMAAILINFSLFFAKVIIDSSNLLATNFYKQIQSIGTKGDSNYGIKKHPNWGGISDSYMQALSFTVLYQTRKDGAINLKNPGIDANVQAFDPDTGKIITKKAVVNIDKDTGEPVLNTRQIFFISLLGSILFLITAFSFLAVTFLLVVRYAVLIFLMMLSPIALAGMILPQMQKYSKMWWDNLIGYAFFAPAYLLLTLIIIRIINSEGFRSSIGFGNINTSVVLIIINFGIIITLIIFSILLSRYMGIWGSELTINAGRSARKWGQGVVGRNTIGRGSRLLRKAYDSGQARMEKSRGGRITRRALSIASLGALSDKSIKGTLSAGESAKFGSGQSYKEESDTYKARRKEVQGVQKEIKQKKVFKKAASGATLGPDDFAVISEMKIKELEKQGIKKHLKNKNVAQHLSTEQLESITKSDEFAQQEIKDIKKARFAEVIKNVQNGDNKLLRALSEKEVEMLGDEALGTDEVITGMAQSQISKITKSGKLSSGLKKHIKDRRENYLNGLPPDLLESELREMKPADIAEVDSSILLKPAASKVYSPAVLIELAKKLKIKDRDAIRNRLDIVYTAAGGTVGPNMTSEQEAGWRWLNKKATPSGVIF
ncbi:MAG: hypothetical protein ACE5F2_02160, partial [Candidatus Paceibacteria bacterium]